ncbi:DnaJ C-terminal domain-containing protein [Magnetovibrio sp.]|uniref:DnaJ C-terminal domain-containing protein n=1 Tax=Magnetovibrio sp. TaxID=2024836 RepID=UPI002F93CC39
MLDPYSALGVKKTASPEDIKKSYRRLAREHHPDHKHGDKRAEERFKDISSAYNLLSDPIKRRKFDAGEIDAMGNKLHAYANAHGFGGAAHGYDAYKRNPNAGQARKNPFNSFFKDRAQKEHQSIKARGADVSYTLKVPFLEAAKGADKSVRMTSGKTLKVRIPAGTETAQVLRLKGQGMAGMGGGAAGDALVEIIVQNDAKYRAEGLDVYSDEAVTLAEALLGGRIEVQTIHGPVLVTVPEGSNSGTKLRLKTKGIHRHGSDLRGDHYVSLKVMLPEDEDSDLKKFVKKWIGKRPYKVRKETLNRTAAE